MEHALIVSENRVFLLGEHYNIMLSVCGTLDTVPKTQRI